MGWTVSSPYHPGLGGDRTVSAQAPDPRPGGTHGHESRLAQDCHDCISLLRSDEQESEVLLQGVCSQGEQRPGSQTQIRRQVQRVRISNPDALHFLPPTPTDSALRPFTTDELSRGDRSRTFAALGFPDQVTFIAWFPLAMPKKLGNRCSIP